MAKIPISNEATQMSIAPDQLYTFNWPAPNATNGSNAYCTPAFNRIPQSRVDIESSNDYPRNMWGCICCGYDLDNRSPSELSFSN
jgi:hypothetical protein